MRIFIEIEIEIVFLSYIILLWVEFFLLFTYIIIK